MDEQKVIVQFTSIVTDGETTLPHVFETLGIIYLEQGTVVELSFIDAPVETEKVASEVTFFFDRDEIIMQRTGEVVMEQKFSKALKTKGLYQTPHGKFQIETKTNHVESALNSKEGEISIFYQAYIGGTYSGEVQLAVSYKSPKNKE